MPHKHLTGSTPGGGVAITSDQSSLSMSCSLARFGFFPACVGLGLGLGTGVGLGMGMEMEMEMGIEVKMTSKMRHGCVLPSFV